MYPPSPERALLESMEAERAISDLIGIALELWLPLAESSALRAAAPPPDPEAVAEQEAQWNYLVDAVVLYGVALVAAHAVDTAHTAIAGIPWALAEAAASLPEPDFPGLPTRTTLRGRVHAVLSRRMGIDPEGVAERLNQVPQIRGFVSDHVASLRDRVLDAVRTAYQRIRGTNEDTDTPEEARTETTEVLDPDEWRDLANASAQTHTTGVLNASTDAAATFAASENPDLLFHYEWNAILDTRVRESHREASGQTKPLGESFTVGGEQLRFPGDPLGSQAQIANCRCRLFVATPTALTADAAPEGNAMEYQSFTAVLAVIGEETDDGRLFADNIDLTFREFPLPLLWQKQSEPGHYSSFTVGVIEDARIDGKQVIGEGYYLDTPEAVEAKQQADHGVTGPSVDLGSVDWEMRDAQGNAITDPDWMWDHPDEKMVETVLAAKVLAATLVSTPAFASTSITNGPLVERDTEALVASATSASGIMPTYPAEFFANPEFAEPTHPHITDDGRIQGHLALFDACHIGLSKTCVTAPRSSTEYAWFHTSPPVTTDTGDRVKVGRLTVGGGHADTRASVGPAIEHYDNVGTCFALVHAGEDEHGIWFSGVPHPSATKEQIVDGLSAPLSGDWRPIGGNRELVAALAVNTPGFGIVASGATDEHDEPLALIASLGPCAEPKAVRGEASAAVDSLALARQIVTEWRSQERRESQALALVNSHNRREALALIQKAGNP